MKISFTQKDLDAIRAAYYDHEGYRPYDVKHIPEQKEYQTLQRLWLTMEHESKKEKCRKGRNEK